MGETRDVDWLMQKDVERKVSSQARIQLTVSIDVR